MKQNLYLSFAAAAIAALASCSSDDYVGENYNTSATTSGESAILFSSTSSAVSRATGGSSAADKLFKSFDILGTKTVGSTVSAVFADDAYSDDGLAGFGNNTNNLYTLWYDANNTSSTNVAGWEYVGDAESGDGYYYDRNSTENATSTTSTDDQPDADQTIKYWDYSASQYDFVAYKATYGGTVSAVKTSGFTFTGSPLQLAGVYVADKRVVTNSDAASDFGETVTLTFRNAATKVRVGFYETIPGYSITSMKFYYDTSSSSESNAFLDGSFVGSSSDYSSATTNTYTIAYDNSGADDGGGTTITGTSEGLTTAKTYYDFGTLTLDNQVNTDITKALATSVSTPTYAKGTADVGDNTYYQYVIPNTSDYAAMNLKVDFVLTSNDGNGETITVTGATATVPAAYMEWKNNYAYTYIFKISQNTNGSTGGTDEDGNPSDPTGLYPITFTAVVVDTEENTQEVISVGNTNDYTINTYQESSDVTENAEYTAGTVYATVYNGTTNKITANTNIYGVTQDYSALAADGVAVYTVTGSLNSGETIAEGDIVDNLNGISNGLTLAQLTTGVEVADFTPSGSSSSNTVKGLSITVGAGTKYAVVYCQTAYVQGSLTQITSESTVTYDADTQYYIKEGDKYYKASGVTADNYKSGIYYYDSDGTTTTYYEPTEGVYAVKYITVN